MPEQVHPAGARTTAPSYRGVPYDELVEDFRLVCTSRAVDERQSTLHKQGRVYFQIAGAGHEALLVALARSLRPGVDWFFPYYRDVALVLALGVSPLQIILQSVGSSQDASSGGRQMPAHWGDKALHIVSQTSPTGSQCLPAVGCAETSRYLGDHPVPGLPVTAGEVTYVSLGDGATSEGEFWESLNTACQLSLPLVYLVADNGYAISVPASDQAPAPVATLVSGFPGIEVATIDGCDYFAARETGARLVARARSGSGPVLLHALVSRPHSHSSSDTQAKYRAAAQIAEDAARDPLLRLERELVDAGVLTGDDVARFKAEAHAAVARDATAALEAARPDPASATDHVVCLPEIPDPPAGAEVGGESVHVGEAIRRTLHEIMAGDERVRVFGEDVADADESILAEVVGMGGVFGTTQGLQRTFGTDRCFNTPLAEANIVGRAVGQALRGLRPSPEIQFFDYIWPAMQQIRSEAATARWRSQGVYTVPLVLRAAIGGYLAGGGPWHSQSGESIFTHIPGLVVLFPSRARDVAGLLRAAFRCEDPVLFFEHKHLFRQRYAMDPFPSPEFVVPIGRAATARRGEDLTIVTWGAMVHRSLLAAEALAEEGISAEVVDLRSLAPFDKEAVAESVRRTSRLLVAHEDTLTSGFGAEIAAFAADECFTDLDAPVRRVASPDTWVPYEPALERAVLPQVADVLEAARRLAKY